MMRMSLIDKISAIILALCFILFVISGFDLQLRIFSIKISSLIHLKYLFLIAEPAFIFHTSFAFHLAFKRKKIWNRAGKILLLMYILFNIALFLTYFLIQY